MSLAPGFHPHVIVLSAEILLAVYRARVVRLPMIGPTSGRRRLAILGMKIEGVRGQVSIECLIVNVEIERIDRLAAFIADRDPRPLAKVLIPQHPIRVRRSDRPFTIPGYVFRTVRNYLIHNHRR